MKKPKDELIEKLYQDNMALHTELSRQTNIIDEAEKYQKERDTIIADNDELNDKVKHMKHEYKEKSNTLDLMFSNRKRDIEEEYEIKFVNMENTYKKKINVLEKEISHLYKVVDKFKDNIFRFLNWLCRKFAISEEESLIRDFQKETNSFLDAEKQLAFEKRQKEKEWDLER